jgi:hypothetical protein
MQQTICRLIREYTAAYPQSTGSETRWDEPLIAFAAADDDLFAVA